MATAPDLRKSDVTLNGGIPSFIISSQHYYYYYYSRAAKIF